MAGEYTQLSVTERLKELVEEALKIGDDALRTELSVWQASDKQTISFDLVRRAHLAISDSTPLHEVLLGSLISLPEYHPPAKSPALEARLRKIQEQLQEKEYRRMVKNVDTTGSQKDALAFGLEMSSLNRQLWTVINFFLTVVCSFVFGYFAAYFANLSITACVLMGLMFGVVVFLADLYFLVRAPGMITEHSKLD